MQKRQRSQKEVSKIAESPKSVEYEEIEDELIDCVHAIGKNQADLHTRKLKNRGDVCVLPMNVSWRGNDYGLQTWLCGPIPRDENDVHEFAIVIPFIYICMIVCETTSDAIRKNSIRRFEWKSATTGDFDNPIDITSMWVPKSESSQSDFDKLVAEMCIEIKDQVASEAASEIRNLTIEDIVVKSEEKVASLAQLTEQIEKINREIQEMRSRAWSIVEDTPSDDFYLHESIDSLKRICTNRREDDGYRPILSLPNS